MAGVQRSVLWIRTKLYQQVIPRMSAPDPTETAKAELKRRSKDCATAQRTLCDAIAATLDAELAYLEAAYVVAVAEGATQKRAADINNRMRYLRAKCGPMAISSAANKIVDTSLRRRIWGF